MLADDGGLITLASAQHDSIIRDLCKKKIILQNGVGDGEAVKARSLSRKKTFNSPDPMGKAYRQRARSAARHRVGTGTSKQKIHDKKNKRATVQLYQ